jgi:hypothetical protein
MALSINFPPYMRINLSKRRFCFANKFRCHFCLASALQPELQFPETPHPQRPVVLTTTGTVSMLSFADPVTAALVTTIVDIALC